MSNTYIGTKVVIAEPMTRQQYNDYRGWALPADENGADAGYLVEYTDGGKANMPDRKGYVSWSPKGVFERAYHGPSGMDFGEAIVAMKQGCRVQREGWNGKGLWLEYCKPIHAVDLPYIVIMYPVNSAPYPNGARVPWLASQTDMLSEDWRIVQ